jgi:hypothetical protein
MKGRLPSQGSQPMSDMPAETIAFLGAVIFAFAAFSLTLAYAWWQTRGKA